MEPVFMILAQSASTAAVMAIDSKIAVQDVPYEALKKKLLEDGQVLVNESAAPKPAGLVTDSAHAVLKGEWTSSTAQTPHLGSAYLHDGNADKGKRSARFEVAIPKPGKYDVRIAYTANPNRATNVPILVVHAGGLKVVKLNQQLAPTFDKLFASVGVFEFTGSVAAIEISNAGTDGYVIVDGVQLVPQ
jgi:hypothetical protein